VRVRSSWFAVVVGALVAVGCPAEDPGPEREPPRRPAPQEVIDEIERLEASGALEDALAEVEKAQLDYPHDATLERKRQRLEEELRPTTRLRDARRLVAREQYDAALDLLEGVIYDAPDLGEPYCLEAKCYPALGDPLAARESLDEARSAGFDEARLQELRERLE